MSSVISSTGNSTAGTATSAAASGSSATPSSGSVSSTGIGSGINVTSIVTSLTTAAGLAQNTQLADRKQSLTAQVSAYGTFSAALGTLQATLTSLQTPSQLAGRTATLGDDKVATASAKANAIPAQYTFSVQNLATAASVSSSPLPSESSTVGTGTLSISVGGTSASLNIDSTNNTLSGIAAAINSAANNPGVTATVLATTSGARLVISGTATGAANAVTVSQSGGDGGLAALAYPGAGATQATQTQAATDANFTVNGFAATSASNQVSSVISGVTLNLLTPSTAGTSTTLTVGNDITGAQTSVGTFVTALNGLITGIQGLTSYDPSTHAAGPLLGNATLQSFQNQLHKILGQVQSGNPGAINSLSALGISATTAGTFSTDSAKLSNALSGNLSSVGSLLGGTNGIATQLNALVNQYTQAGGLLVSLNQGLQSGLTDVANQQTALNARLATYSATLTKEYNAMDTAVALLKQTQTYLTAEFNPTSNSSSSSNSALGSGNVSTR